MTTVAGGGGGGAAVGAGVVAGSTVFAGAVTFTVLPVVGFAVCAAAVSDWRVARPYRQKLKKQPGGSPPALVLAENPDILKTLSAPGPQRPKLVVGFAAETEDLLGNARRKLQAKGCDWIVANDVSSEHDTFGGVDNTVKLICRDAEPEAWPRASKLEVARRLVARIAAHLRDAAAAAA